MGLRCVEMEGLIVAVDVNAGQGVLVLDHAEVRCLPRIVAKRGKLGGNVRKLPRRAKAIAADHTAVVPLLCPEHIALVVLTAMALASEIQASPARAHRQAGRLGGLAVVIRVGLLLGLLLGFFHHPDMDGILIHESLPRAYMGGGNDEVVVPRVPLGKLG